MSVRIDDRVWHKSDPNCTGTVVGLSQTMACVNWDFTSKIYSGENPSWWFFDELYVIPTPLYNIPPPKIEQPKEEENMSQALWCDKGGHAFSAKDTDREHYTSTRSVKDGMTVTQVTAELDICGPCTKDVVLFEAPQLTSGSTVQDKVPGQ